MFRHRFAVIPAALVGFCAGLLLNRCEAVILWSDLGATLAHETGLAADILGGALKRDNSTSGTLYFRFHVEPLSDSTTEEYFAGFELYEADTERLGVGNAWKAWAYTAFFNTEEASNRVAGYIDLRSAHPEPTGQAAQSVYELPRRGVGRTIVFKVQYVAGEDDLVTAWLDPDLGPGANELSQPDSLTTRFTANASFDSIRLRHGGRGEGWTFSAMAIATSFSDFVDTSSAKSGATTNLLSPRPAAFRFHSWQGQQGMPHSPIEALAQTLDGYLWVGGDDGLSRFDGARFVAMGNQSALEGRGVRVLLGDSKGRLWVGTDGGELTSWESNKFISRIKSRGPGTDAITSLAEDKDGKIWVGTRNGLLVEQSGRFEPLSVDEPISRKTITLLYKDPAGKMWVGAEGAGVFQFEAGQFTALESSSMAEFLREPHCLLVDRTGRLWLGAGEDSVLCLEGNQWRRYRIPRHNPSAYVKALAEDADGTIWAGSVSEGLFRMNGGRLKGLEANSGLTDNRVKSLLVAREGKLWVGTDSGLNEFRRNQSSFFGQDEGLGYGPVLGMCEVSPGVIWAAKPRDGLYRYEGRTFSRLSAAGLPLREPQVNTLLVTREGSCLVGHAHGVLRFKDPQAVSDESIQLGLTNYTIIALSEDANGGIWAGAREGAVWRLVHGQWEEQKGMKQAHPISAIIPLTGGGAWIGTEGAGLFRFGEPGPAHYGKTTGLSSDAIRTLYLDNTGTLWIGTAGGGLNWLRDGQVAKMTPREGIRNDTISQILEDDAGSLWFGGDRGIECISKAALEKIVESNHTTAPLAGRTEGMFSEACTGGFFPSGLKTKAGLLWFSTSMGVVATQPPGRANSAPPRVEIEEIMADQSPFPLFDPAKIGEQILKVGPGKFRLEIQYTALGSEAPESIRFRYRMQGLENDWTEAGGRRSAVYNYLPPGNYEFQVSACDQSGIWSDTSSTVKLAVSRHFWESWWVIGPAIIVLVGSIAGTARLVEYSKLQRRLKRLEQERGLERERTRIAQDLHDEMGAKLCRISFLSEHARRSDKLPSELQHEIASISDASREVLHSLDEIVWAVNPQNDTLEHLASYIAQYAQDYFQMTGIACELSVPARLPMHRIPSQTRHHLFLAAHEAFTNILKHSGANQANVAVNCNGAFFEIAASDNGIGFNPGANQNGGASTSGQDGLRNMARRLSEIGGRCQVESRPGQGTTIRLVVPLDGVNGKNER